MKRAFITAAVFAALTIPVSAQAQDTILEFKTMAGVSGPFVGSANPIRGVGGGGIPWRLDEAKGELKRDGRLEVRVRGLVLAAGDNAGTNPAATFRAIVSCKLDAAQMPPFLNLATAEFAATPTGDSNIKETLQLPDQCFAPIVFVTNAAGRWFAVTGY